MGARQHEDLRWESVCFVRDVRGGLIIDTGMRWGSSYSINAIALVECLAAERPHPTTVAAAVSSARARPSWLPVRTRDLQVRRIASSGRLEVLWRAPLHPPGSLPADDEIALLVRYRTVGQATLLDFRLPSPRFSGAELAEAIKQKHRPLLTGGDPGRSRAELHNGRMIISWGEAPSSSILEDLLQPRRWRTSWERAVRAAHEAQMSPDGVAQSSQALARAARIPLRRMRSYEPDLSRLFPGVLVGRLPTDEVRKDG